MSELQKRLQAALGDAYRVERELGGGGMSRVFVATDTALDRQVVVKVLPPDLAAGLNVERFRREIQLAAKLQHPHIVPLLAAGAADGLLYYTMPLIEGESLRAKLERQGELPVPEAVRILRDVADALAYAHEHGLVHRDIKPDNVLLSGRHAVVTDFGVSKALSSATGEASITSIGVALGTPAYMAPEQAAADPGTDHRADIYALGIVAYELLTGHTPFTGLTAQQVLAAHMTQAPPPVTENRGAVPAVLATLVMRCLEKRAADRPQTAEQIVEVLGTLGTPSGGTAPTAPVSVTERAPTRFGRKWMVGIAGTVVLIALVALFLFKGDRVGAASARSIAVLPFDNIGGGDAGQAFSDGIQDDILTQLTKISALAVTSRASVQGYRGTKQSVRDIGRELGVRALLEGQVQRADNKVRVNVQLIDAETDRQLWAETYNRDLTAQDVFAIQDSIASNVAEALRVQLTPAEVAAIAQAPTANLDALDYYHRGRELFDQRGSTGADTGAPAAYLRAVTLDPTFAAAWAGLAASRSWLIRQYAAFDTTSAREALDRAVALAPAESETRMAQGFYAYYAKGDYATALEHFRAVERARPSDLGAVQAVGYILRRQGHWAEALTYEERVTVLDPRDPGALWDLGGSYISLRRFVDARPVLQRALILQPDYDIARVWLFWSFIAAGDTVGAATVATADWGHQSFWALEETQASLAVFRRDFPTAIRGFLTAHARLPIEKRGRLLELAMTYHAAGQVGAARVYADSVRLVAEEDLRRLEGWPDIFGRLANDHGYLGMADALLGKRDDALREARLAVQLNPISRDVLEGARSLAQLAAVFTLIGERDSAIAGWTYLTTVPASYPDYGPSTVSAGILRLDPLYDPLRSDPRFKKLVEGGQ